MRILVSGATSTLRDYLAHPHAARLGQLLTPANRNSTRGLWLPWAADNAAFSGFDEPAFVAMLRRIAGSDCRWVTAPDVVADAAATLALFERWEPILRSYRVPVALVAQDGLTPEKTPWERLDCLFIGGSTEFKIGHEAAVLAAEAKRRSRWLHIGRVNTLSRLDYCLRLGADSIDGSGFSRFSRTVLPQFLARIAAYELQPVFL